MAEWIAQAQATAEIPEVAPELQGEAAAAGNDLPATPLRVVTQRFEPFVIYENQAYSGFSAERGLQLPADGNPYTTTDMLTWISDLAEGLDQVETAITARRRTGGRCDRNGHQSPLVLRWLDP
ncbi:hypothetical protein XM38_050930 [Halomicronema hongdechloris C2206]|uniref:Uncharacterized protein n=1 Tax=Halomicronema hongdechloris C2206 TaxID=1641165 RepID=A0A1Z3HUX4_9CYAN|nr:hypothetical protein [Halomicronema hongdechloris]ASC74118.1 hypothetical protein XM38_050930 [Halomicronema hongdechloris C2206]